VSINACRTGPFPATVEDAEDEDIPSEDENDLPEDTTSDIPFDLENGDRVWAVGLLPEAEYVRAISSHSQPLAEGFSQNSESSDTPDQWNGIKGIDTRLRQDVHLSLFGRGFCQTTEPKAVGPRD